MEMLLCMSIANAICAQASIDPRHEQLVTNTYHNFSCIESMIIGLDLHLIKICGMFADTIGVTIYQ